MFPSVMKLAALSAATIAWVANSVLPVFALTASEINRLEQLCGGRRYCASLTHMVEMVEPDFQEGPISNRRELRYFSSGGTTFVMGPGSINEVTPARSIASQFSGGGFIRFTLHGTYDYPNGQAVGQSRIYSGECAERDVRSSWRAGMTNLWFESAYEFDAQGNRLNEQRLGQEIYALAGDEAQWSLYACYLAYDLPLIQQIFTTGQMPVDPDPFH